MKMLSWPTRLKRVSVNATVLALVSFAAVGCSDDSTGPGGPITGVDVVVLPIGTTTTNLPRGLTVQLLAAPHNAANAFIDIPVTWSSSDAARATVSANGLVTTVGGGDVTITATAGGQSGTFNLNIQYPIGTVTVGTPAGSIRQEGTVGLAATLLGTDGQPALARTVTWSSANTAIATVSSSGVVSGVTNGTVAITATSEGVSGSTNVTVSGSPLVATVTVTPATPFKGTGQTQQMTHASRAASGTTIGGTTATWSSSATGVATVSATGLVTITGTGTSTISATVDNGVGTNVVGTTVIRGAPLLVNGVARAGDNTATAEATWYAYEVPAGATSFSVTTSGGTGDADVYIFAPGVIPSAINTSTSALAFSNATDFSALSGNSESISRSGPPEGTWRIAVFAWGGAPAVTGLTITGTNAP